MPDYIPAEFTLTAYENLLHKAKEHFLFCSYTDYDPDGSFVLWRHDVDLSLEQAARLAAIEKNQNVRATYFIHLHNEFYNALDSNSLKLMRDILNCGHSIGLHFDIWYYGIQSLEQLLYWLKFEKKILENLLHVEIPVFSFHNTNEYSMSFEEISYAGMINTYSAYFKQKVTYCSDSNGYWRFKKLSDVLTDSSVKRLQVLTHPGWWTEGELSPRDKIVSYVNQRRELTLQQYDSALKNFDRENIS